jgi:hypothetical protein
MNDKTVPVIVNLTQDNYDTVAQLSKKTGLNRATIINQAIITEKFIAEAKEQKQRILIENQDGSTQEVIFG